MKKITALIMALAVLFCFSLPAYAEDEKLLLYPIDNESVKAVLYDDCGALSKEAVEVLYDRVYSLSEKTGYGICLACAGNISDGGSELDGIKSTFGEICGADYFGIVFLTDSDKKNCLFYTEGVFSPLLDAACPNVIYNTAIEFVEKGDFYAAGTVACMTFETIVDNGYSCATFPDELKGETAPAAPAEDASDKNAAESKDEFANITDGKYKKEISGHFALLHDLDDSLSQDKEKAVFDKLCEVVKKHGFSVCILISNNIGTPKNDRQSIDYADVYYEKECGMNTDGILLLMNNDTQFDWISTSGRCESVFNEEKTDRLFDYFYSALEKNNDYYAAACGFCEAVDKCASGDPYFSQKGSGKTDYHFDSKNVDLSAVFFFFLIIVTVEACVVGGILSKYKLKAVKGANPYVLKNSLVFSENEDKYIRTYVTHHTVSSSSSHSGGHHSSGHHSSGGGHHGGGGRHR